MKPRELVVERRGRFGIVLLTFCALIPLILAHSIDPSNQLGNINPEFEELYANHFWIILASLPVPSCRSTPWPLLLLGLILGPCKKQSYCFTSNFVRIAILKCLLKTPFDRYSRRSRFRILVHCFLFLIFDLWSLWLMIPIFGLSLLSFFYIHLIVYTLSLSSDKKRLWSIPNCPLLILLLVIDFWALSFGVKVFKNCLVAVRNRS